MNRPVRSAGNHRNAKPLQIDIMNSYWPWIFWLAAFAVGYAQIGYGLILRILFRKSRHGRQTSDFTPHVSLIIPAHNEQAVIGDKLDNALALDYPRELLEIIVAGDGCSDNTVEIARTYASQRVRVLEFTARRGKAAVMNDAIAEATGELICLCDANVMFAADAVKQLVATFHDEDVGAVGGDVQLASQQASFGKGEILYYRIERLIQQAETLAGSTVAVDGGMYMIRRELYRPLPEDTILDDFVTSTNVLKQGKRVVYEPSAVATENATPSATQEFRRRVRVSAGAAQVLKRAGWPPLWRPLVLWQFVSHKLLRWIEPALLLLLLISNAVLWNSGIVYRVALIAQTMFYVSAIAAVLSVRFRQTKLGGISFYFSMSHVAMAVGLLKGMLNLQQVTWKPTERTAAPREINATPVN